MSRRANPRQPRTYSFDRAVHLSPTATAYSRLGPDRVLSVERDGDEYHMLALNGRTRELEAQTALGRKEFVDVANRTYGVSLTRPVWVPAHTAHPGGTGVGTSLLVEPVG